MWMLGGMRIPMAAEAHRMEADSSAEYPLRFIEGIRSEPTAATSAVADPEMPENRISVTTTTCPRPPRIRPTITMARSTMRWEMPEVSMSAPPRMKRGTARRMKESTPASIRWGITLRGTPP